MSAFIPVTEASVMTARYRQHRESILQESLQGHDLLPICETFDKSQVETLLQKSGCTQLRCYYGMDEDLTVHLVLVAAGSGDEDILPPTTENVTQTSEEDEDFTVDRANRCPDYCPPASPLNS